MPKPKRRPRNPHARALFTDPKFKPKVVTSKKRKGEHRREHKEKLRREGLWLGGDV